MYENSYDPFCSSACVNAWYKQNQDVMQDMGLKNMRQVKDYYKEQGYENCPNCDIRTAFTPSGFFIMKPKATTDYLYDYAKVVEVYEGYQIVGLEQGLELTGNMDYYLNYQMMRVASGLDLAARETFDTINAARAFIREHKVNYGY